MSLPRLAQAVTALQGAMNGRDRQAATRRALAALWAILEPQDRQRFLRRIDLSTGEIIPRQRFVRNVKDADLEAAIGHGVWLKHLTGDDRDFATRIWKRAHGVDAFLEGGIDMSEKQAGWFLRLWKENRNLTDEEERVELFDVAAE